LSCNDCRGRLFAILVAVAFSCGALSHTAHGADIRAGRDGDGNNIIVLKGPIEAGDAAKIINLKDRLYPLTLHLDSPGGSYNEALKIIDAIYPVQPVPTLVNEGSVCYSACALIFMAGHTGGGSAGIFSDRKLHYRARLGFHAPYLSGVQGQFSGAVVEETYRLAIEGLRKLMNKRVISASLLTEMLGKGPNEAFVIDNVDKAGRWDIHVFGHRILPITRKMFCKACENIEFWKSENSSINSVVSRCSDNGTISNQSDGFRMRKKGSKYYIRILFPLARGLITECKLIVSPGSKTLNNMPWVIGTFGAPGKDIEQNDLDRFHVYPFHYFDASTPLSELNR
jgi:ATP-dependent protease ClpP protease subunit